MIMIETLTELTALESMDTHRAFMKPSEGPQGRTPTEGSPECSHGYKLPTLSEGPGEQPSGSPKTPHGPRAYLQTTRAYLIA